MKILRENNPLHVVSEESGIKAINLLEEIFKDEGNVKWREK